jgi:hypothetical protein
MSLTTIMSHAGLSGYAIAGMLIFLAVFISLMVRLWLQARKGGLEEVGRLPLEEGRPVAAPGSLVPPAHGAAKNEEGR